MENFQDLYSEWNDSTPKKKNDIGFDVKEKIKELMKASPNSINSKLSSKYVQLGRKRKGDINKGVGHNIRRPKFKKAKDKVENKAKKITNNMKKIPPRLPSNRSPVKPGEKLKRHKLSSPGLSLLDSPSEHEETVAQSRKFFTSRSKAAAIVNINNAIKLSSMNGEITMNHRGSNFEKKNIGRVIEEELEKKIANTSLQSPVGKSLEKIKQLSVASSPTPIGPTRFADGTSPRKSLVTSANNTPTRRVSPRKQQKNMAETKGSRNSPYKRSPQKNGINHGADGTQRISPQKQRKNVTETKIVRTPYKDVISHAEGSQLDSQREIDKTPKANGIRKETLTVNSSKVSPLRRKSLVKSLENIVKEKETSHELEGEQELEDLELAFHQIESNVPDAEDAILTTLLKDNQTPEKNENLRRSPRKHIPSHIANAERTTNGTKLVQTVKTSRDKNVKYFPLFESKQYSKVSSRDPILVAKSSIGLKKKYINKKRDDSQLIIDAGQKEFGAKFCKECGTLYEVGNPQDEKNHTEIHNLVFTALHFNGWKSERQVTNLDQIGGRILKVVPEDGHHWWRKVKEVLEIVDRDLGFVESGLRCIKSSTAFLYILEKTIVGIVIVESIEKAYRIIQQGSTSTGKDDKNYSKLICCSDTPQKISFGISRIWVVTNQRKKGIATRLVDAMRSNLISYHFLTIDDFAFSDPTQFGMQFAEKYTKKADFLVYRRE